MKILIGYPVLRDGLITPNDYQRMIAFSLLDSFYKYNGAVYGEDGEKIDIPGLIADAKKTAQKVVDDLGKVEGKYRKPQG